MALLLPVRPPAVFRRVQQALSMAAADARAGAGPVAIVSSPVLQTLVKVVPRGVTIEPTRHRRINPFVQPHLSADAVPGEGLPAAVTDVWEAGLSLRIPAPLSRGRQIGVLIPRKGRRPEAVLCTVTMCNADGTDYRVAADFGASAMDTLAHLLLHPKSYREAA